MIERLLARAASLAIAHPARVVIAGWLTALSALYVVFVPVDLSFSGVMNREHPEVERYFEASARYGLGGLLPLLLTGPEEELDRAVTAVRVALDGMEEVRAVQVPPTRDDSAAFLPWIVERSAFDAWIALAQGPPSPDALAAFRKRIDAEARRLAPAPPAGQRLITVVMARDTFELALDADDFPAIRRSVEETLAPLGVRGRFAGMPAIVTQEQEATIERLQVLGPVSLVLVLALLLSVERRGLVLASVAVPMLLSVSCTLALLGAIEGRLTLMESIFGVIVFGLGIDFAIHLLLRMREERANGLDFEASLQRAILGTGRGVVAGGVTTAGAFLIIALSPDPVFRRLGLAGGMGLLLCLGFLLFMLPAQWTWIERRRPGPSATLRSRSIRGFEWLAAASARHPLRVAAAILPLLAWSGSHLGAIHYETNLERVFSRDIDAVETAREIHDAFGIAPGPWVVPAADLESARSISADFEAEPMFGRVESLAQWIPNDVDERQQALEAIAPKLSAAITLLKSSGKDGDALAPFERLLAAHAQGPPRPDTLPRALAQRWIGPNDERLVYAYPAAPALDSAVAARERRVAQAIDPRATSMAAIYEALIGTDRPWMPPIVAGVLLFMAVIVSLDLRSFRLAALALIPVSASAIATVGVLTAFGFSFNTVTLVAIPMLLGLGVDDGIHVVHRLKEQPTVQLASNVASVAASIALTTVTTCGSIGVLLFTRHPGIESVAILLLVGLPMTLLATVVLIPAVAGGLGWTPRAGDA